ncbi:GRF1-interacting factor 1-like [Rhododendron vialii]|uniref:GRF1-interacting factor 1-like n=1 Tax=Rhododendron vialii TaxID=182163 RepID=UPI00265E513E|nr:GRF1-interacting factor 1-like [Rhododendron vialii]
MQQHLMQMQPMMAAYYPNNVTTDHIQQYLDENKSLILKIVESQNSGKLSECAENQARLQRNLMYLAAIADSQPQPPTMQIPPSGIMQPGSHYLQHQQAQQMTPQALMAARSSALYSQQQYLALQQQQALHSQLGMSSGGSSGLHMMQQSEANSSGSTGGGLGGGGGFPIFGLVTGGGGSKQEMGSGEGRGGSSGGHGGEGSDYLKAGEDGN